ncbi:uncharacterized protein BO66DRAFT_458154 [Aspergillus aculeatinus CBS 121060]|uniref:Uncharacterized protein n=1 Tax=Aspergillus aculeatinus CBS 121060 TaxID=1448322 RepID=A0ACD1H158_9EURO|nr:hypothetical protein BO66DRAFT_458154 [Aspergillus aculeatinus CBS 121060]RAH67300.1 hypothetical protein BO66DRAFT_458154 [Aspergillus aculeatinus CBS 121060]
MNSADGEPRVSYLETFRPGYPRYSALLSTHASFQKFRRFTEVRMRLLLLKQDEISVLEQALSRADADEPHGLFLGCARRDQNSTRKKILDELRTHLAEYDTMLQQTQWVQSLSDSSARDIQSLQNWVQGTGCIAREERKYLDHDQDLASLVTPPDIAVERTLPLLEDFLCFLQRTSRRLSFSPATRKNHYITEDENIFIVGPWIRRVSQAIATWMATLALLTPIIILFVTTSPVARLVTIIVAAGVSLTTMSLFTGAKTMEIFIAGAG